VGTEDIDDDDVRAGADGAGMGRTGCVCAGGNTRSDDTAGKVGPDERVRGLLATMGLEILTSR